MTQDQQRPDDPKQGRTRIALAALTGLVAGVSRALTHWLLSHLAS